MLYKPAILRFFEYKHLPPGVQVYSEQFHELAHQLVVHLPENDPELEVGLRKLLEAKDCIVRAALLHEEEG